MTVVDKRVIRVVGIDDPGYTHQLTFASNSFDQVQFRSGESFDILQLLEFSLGFTHTALRDTQWPLLSTEDNKSWTGIGRLLQQNKADLSITPVYYLSDRVKSFSFLAPTSFQYLVACFRQPPQSNVVIDIYTTTIKPQCWLVLGMVVLATLGMACLVSYLQNGPSKNVQLEENLTWIFVTLCRQSYYFSPINQLTRITYISLSMTAIVMMTALSANLLSIRSNTGIQTIEQLVAGSFQFYRDNATLFISDDTLEPWITQSSEIESIPGIGKVLSGISAFVTFDAFPYNIYRNSYGLEEDVICNSIVTMSIPGTHKNIGMLVQKDSEWKEILNPKILKLRETGFLRKIASKWSPSVAEKCRTKLKPRPHSSFQPVAVGDVYTIFVAFCIAAIISSSLILIEMGLDTRCLHK